MNMAILSNYSTNTNHWATNGLDAKVVSIVNADKTARHIVTYFNEEPIDNNTGKPKNEGWKKYFEFIHTGQGDKYKIPHTWGGAKNTWRNDWLTSIDIAYMNHREISTFSNPI